MITPQDNRDPRWTAEINAAIEKKVDEAMAFKPRLELMGDDMKMASKEERRSLLLISFREIVKATSIDMLMRAPPALLEQISVLALVNNENVKGVLNQVMRVYMLLWGLPETNEYARNVLIEMESRAKDAFLATSNPKAEVFKWEPPLA